MEQSYELTPVDGLENVFYIPNFVTDSIEALYRKIQESAQPLWKELPNRRLQIWGGDMTSKGILIPQPLPSFINKFPDIVSRIKATGIFNSSPHKGPNHVIMNEYLPGQGIMPHEDGPRYYPVVATLSLGSHAVFHYYRYEEDNEHRDSAVGLGNGKTIDMTPISSVLLEPRSLIISSGTMYTSHLHGIEAVEEDIISSDTSASGTALSNLSLLQDDQIKKSILQGKPLKRATRYSLTCRDVTRVSSSKLNILHRH
ncbi:hypothetical protein CPC08DRAFT_638263 [Agrocybe pediades]|nr:hypothetical protein CPC08DRAFT_638263 [Agrocybe pediades]